ncbi:3,4-dihydroxy-2-butanone-4-phosphate synthase [Bacillus luteolus]|uniref:3,4-dihydroxy-2-butanone 4-phosphate synthase n=1 Tax=Litchfieldia luteola TaxID=682179 RepID=A0ABR9QFR9_9BACI|nr:3,4-dihydroxy-2-butanone-4-phosphate synthase [Cytobacillus luteolus]MBE4907340.1 3,4-dihydroxy-2-butanone-4-phosphate synthase [Cytobacillus luteolus]MBP1943887.1 3,4-dihydroxy-2-butanone 4-phosphate synthase [Cytobacillus luteolus]
MTKTAVSRVEMAIEEVSKGKMVIIQDDESRENEGDLVMAAEKVTGEHINFIATYGKGLICTPMLEDRLNFLNLPQMVEENEESLRTAFTVSVDAKEGITTGISAYERAHTILKLIDSTASPQDFVRPGHVFPLKARSNGVLDRRGQTEASIDLMKLAGLYPAAVICEIMGDDGHMARRSDLEVFAIKHELALITVQDIVDYRVKQGYLNW